MDVDGLPLNSVNYIRVDGGGEVTQFNNRTRNNIPPLLRRGRRRSGQMLL